MNPPSHDRQPQALTANTRPPSHDVQNFTCNMALPEKLHMKHEFHIWDSTKNSPNQLRERECVRQPPCSGMHACTS